MISATAHKGIRRFSAALLAATLSLSSAAYAVPAAEQLVKDTTDRVIHALKEEREIINKDPKRLFVIVDEIILPHFDFEKMSRRVLGKHWNRASEDQRQKFVSEFQILLVRTYATALKEYSEQKIEFLATLERDGGEMATVRTQISQSGSPPIPIHYEMYRKDDAWKVFDVSIDGVSLVINYRSTFSSEIRSNGVDGLIARLAKHNSEQR